MPNNKDIVGRVRHMKKSVGKLREMDDINMGYKGSNAIRISSLAKGNTHDSNDSFGIREEYVLETIKDYIEDNADEILNIAATEIEDELIKMGIETSKAKEITDIHE